MNRDNANNPYHEPWAKGKEPSQLESCHQWICRLQRDIEKLKQENVRLRLRDIAFGYPTNRRHADYMNHILDGFGVPMQEKNWFFKMFWVDEPREDGNLFEMPSEDDFVTFISEWKGFVTYDHPM